MLFKLYAPQNGKLCVWEEAVPLFVFQPSSNNRRHRNISVTQPREALLAPCMYRTLTSLSIRLYRRSRTPFYHDSLAASTRALPTSQSRHSRSRNCQISLYTSPVPAALASSTESLPGMAAQMLLGRADAYEGFIVSADDLPTAPEEFDSQLEHSLQVRGLELPVIRCASFAQQSPLSMY